MELSRIDTIISLAKEKGMIRPRDLDGYGIPRAYLSRLCDKGQLERLSRGIYSVPGTEITEHYSLVQACKRVPKGVICLLSALRFIDLTTQSPSDIWIAIDRKARLPKSDGLPFRFVRFSGDALYSGVELHVIDGVEIKVYSPAKTVVDCFKYRNKIGLDVALEALRECWHERRCSMGELWHFAKICRMTNVMRPYLESLS